MPLPHELDRELATLLGEGWLTDASERLTYAYDNSRRHALPDAVALPRTRDQVVALVREKIGAVAAFKTVAFGSGVNVTLGLPFPRTSPDHGTALDIAGRGIADPGSMREATALAIRLSTKIDSSALRG